MMSSYHSVNSDSLVVVGEGIDIETGEVISGYNILLPINKSPARESVKALIKEKT